jgi:iron complex transport system substrate-binding protein
MAVKPLLAGALAGLVLLAACGGDDDDGGTATTAVPAATSPASTTPESTSAGTDGTTPDGDVPQRIVSLSPTATEVLFAIGAGDQVIAVDDQSNFPAEAAEKMTDLSGFQPNVEAIADYEPDLVVTSNAQLQDQLEPLGLTVWVGDGATSFDDSYAQIEQLGAATGHVAEAAELVAQMQADLAALAADVPASQAPLKVLHELDATGYAAASNTFIGQVYDMFGLQNIADLADDPSGYPQLSAEAIVEADPDLIFLADTKCCGESLETVSARPGWADITAVRDGNAFEMDDDIASRWGPRVVDYARQVHDAVQQVSVPAG